MNQDKMTHEKKTRDETTGSNGSPQEAADTSRRSPLDAVKVETTVDGLDTITLRDYLRFLHNVLENLHEVNGALQEQLNTAERSLRAYDSVISQQQEHLRDSLRKAMAARKWLV